ncbi:MAG: hypothetical protein AAF433_01105 [Bacteroidota bacterium]
MRTLLGLLLLTGAILFFFACGGESATSTKAPDEPSASSSTTETSTDSPTTNERAFNWIISETGFNGLSSGLRFSELSDELELGIVEMGEGDFEVHFIPGPDGDPIGYILPHPWDESLTGTVVFRSSEVRTPAGITVGNTYGDLRQLLPDIEVHGSEIEGHTYAEDGELLYRLDSYNWAYDLTGIDIDPTTQILEINIPWQVLEGRQPPGMSENLWKLQGDWQSTEDPNSRMSFVGQQKVETYAGIPDARTESNIQLGADCLNGENPVSEEDTYISEPESGLCWAILTLTDNELELAFMGRGNRLKYRKVE